jgi:hypothetical protein
MATSQRAGHTAQSPAEAAHAPAGSWPVSNWAELAVGETVLLVSAGTERYTGVVDDVSADGAVIWLVLDDGVGRRLFHQTDGYRTIVDPDERQKQPSG